MRRVPIFPLPETVLFPSVRLPLHLFEPRYLQMAEDVLRGDRLFVVVLLRPGWQSDYYGNPPVHEVATLGRLESHERLDDGRFDIVLQGIERVRLLPPAGEEQRQGKLYRVRVVRPAPEIAPSPAVPTGETARRLRASWREIETRSGRSPGDDSLEEEDVPFEALVNRISSRVDVPPGRKQDLLEKDDLLKRAALLERYIDDTLDFWRALARFRRLVPDDPRVN
jgi:uncharacterized protein